jgi:hypothetical protein
VSILSKQDVLGLDIPVDDAALVEVGESEEDLDDIEPGDVLIESSVAFDESEQLSSGAVLDNEDEKLLSLECEFHLNEEGMGGILHDVALVHDNVLLPVLDDHLLVDHLHRIELTVLLEPAEEHLRKTSRTDHFNDLETI